MTIKFGDVKAGMLLFNEPPPQWFVIVKNDGVFITMFQIGKMEYGAEWSSERRLIQKKNWTHFMMDGTEQANSKQRRVFFDGIFKRHFKRFY